MNANLTNARKAYFDKVHRIQRDQKCTFTEAKKIYSAQQNGDGEASLSLLTPDALIELAQSKADELGQEISGCMKRMESLQVEIERWQKIGKALDKPLDQPSWMADEAVPRTTAAIGPPPNPPKAAYPHEVG